METNIIKTLFTLESRNFLKDTKQAAKSVEAVKESVAGTKKQVEALSKAFKSVNDLDISVDADSIKSAQRELKRVELLMTDIDRAADKVLDGLEDPVDTSNIEKVKDMLNSMRNIDMIDTDKINRSFNHIQSEIRSLSSQKISIDADLNLDDSAIRGLTTEIDTLIDAQVSMDAFNNEMRHWIDNNGTGMSQQADDTHRLLQDINRNIKEISFSDNPIEQADGTLDTSKLEESNQAMAKAIQRSNDAIKDLARSMGDSVERTGDYTDEMIKIRDQMKDISYDKDLISDGLLNVPEQYEDAFESAEQVILRIKKQLKGLFDEFNEIDIKSYSDLEKIINRIQGAQKELGEQTLSWLNETSRLEEEYNQIKKRVDEVNKALSEEKDNHKINALRDQLRLLNAEEAQYEAFMKINKKVTEELKDQSVQLEKARIAQSNQVETVREQHREQQRVTKELQEQGRAAKQLKSSFGDIGSALEPLRNIPGLDQVVDTFSTVSGSIKNASSGLSGLSGTVREAGGAMSLLSSSSSSVATVLASFNPVVAGVVAGLVALVGSVASVIAGFGAMKKVMDETLPAFIDLDDAISQFIATTGDLIDANGDMIASFAETKEVIMNGFMNQGYTDQIDEYVDALRRVEQQLSDLTDASGKPIAIDLDQVTKDALMLSKVMGYDVNEVVRATRNMVINFGIDIETTFDMMLKAFQKTGDPMNDLLDTMQEYPAQFKKMGVSADFFYDIITRGSEAGIYNTDKIADTFKELYLRISEGSGTAQKDLLELGYSLEDIAKAANATDSVAEAFSRLDISVNAFKHAIAEGGQEAETALYTLIDAIAAVEDKASQQQIIADLFGAPGEDVGSYFFEVLANGEIAIDEFVGAVGEASQVLENTLSYQISQLGNNFNMLKAQVGETFGAVLLPILQELNLNFQTIVDAVQNYLIPAFETLGFALIDPFIEADQTFTEFIANMIQGVSQAIEAFAQFINVANGVIAAFRLVGNVVEIVWNAAQIVVTGIIALFNTVVYGVIGMIGEVIDAITGFVMNWKTGMNNCSVAVHNFVEGMKQKFSEGFNTVQKRAASMVNGIIGIMNKIPGIDIGTVSWGDSGTYQANYRSYEAYSNKGTDIGGWAWDKLAESNSQASSIIGNNLNDLKKDVFDLGDAWGDLGKSFSFNKRLDESKKKLNDLKKTQKELNKEATSVGAIKPPTNHSNLSGSDPTGKDMIAAQKDAAKKEAAAQKKKDDQKKNAQKEINDLIAKEKDHIKELNELLKEQEQLLKDIQNAIKKQIELEKSYSADRRKWQEAIIAQEVQLMTNKESALQYEINMIQQIRDEYVLTAEEQISYQQKQFSLAISLRDQMINRYKSAIQKEIDLIKKRAKEEYEIQKKTNDKLIKDKERQIKAIDALMRENEYNENQEDLDYEIKKTEEELQKYLYATSHEGIQKRQELQEKLRELELEKKRAQNKKELEDQKDKLEQEIEDIKDADEEALKQAEEKAAEMEKIYDDMFAELEDLIQDGMLDIGKIQELAQTETNATIKNLLSNLVTEYQSAYQQIAKYMLNMKDILGWNSNDAMNDIIEGTLTGDQDKVDTGKDTIDKDNNWKPGQGNSHAENVFIQAQELYNKLKKEHAGLTSLSNPTSEQKSRIKTVEAQISALRSRWGFSGYQDSSKFSGSITMDAAAAQKEISELKKLIAESEARLNALSQKKESSQSTQKSRSTQQPQQQQQQQQQQSTFTVPDFNPKDLPTFSNSLNPQAFSMDRSIAGITNNITEDNSVTLNIENYNQNTNADVDRLSQQINSRISIKNRSKGKR